MFQYKGVVLKAQIHKAPPTECDENVANSEFAKSDFFLKSEAASGIIQRNVKYQTARPTGFKRNSKIEAAGNTKAHLSLREKAKTPAPIETSLLVAKSAKIETVLRDENPCKKRLAICIAKTATNPKVVPKNAPETG